MSRVENLFAKAQERGMQPDTKNADGFVAFKVSLEEDYVQMVMTNTIGNTYYADQKKLYDRSMELHRAMLKKDPKFMAQTAIYARNAGMMRMQPIIAVAHLSTVEDKTPFHSAFQRVIKTPGDLVDFITVLGSLRKGRGLGRSVKRAINFFLNSMDEYRAIKYGGGSEGWTLKDIIKACHPVPGDTKQGALFNYLSTGKTDKQLEQIACIEQLKQLNTNDEQYTQKVVDLIERGRLPYEVVTGIVKPNQQIWEYLMKQMPIFATVRQLNTLEKAGVFSKKENVQHVVDKLRDPELISKSRMLPFRFSTAYKNYRGIPAISNALEKALDLSLDNAKVIPGKTAWFLDVSGSMSGEYLEIGAILALAGMKQSKDSFLLNFESSLHCPTINTERSVMSNLEAARKGHGGGTSTDLTIKYLLGQIDKANEKRGLWGGGGYAHDFPQGLRTTTPTFVDNIVIITDEVQNSGSPVVKLFREYRQKVNKDAKLFIIDIAPYEGRLANQDEPGVTFIYGWNDSVLDILKYTVDGNGNHVDTIKRVAV